MSRDNAVLLDIAKASRLVLDFIRGMDQPAFFSDLKTQSAVLHQIMVLGEAVRRLSPAFRQSHSAIPWVLIAGMRDKLIHAYDAVDLDEVCGTGERDIPPLLRFVEPLLPKEK
ncbi:MAG: DUF86 domain-containing protein [Dehalococcoidia bacterium]|nr:DUF86 domain-containing protein [Dehalococcoidia bacterium]MSQ17101.1 DUF86 domain-containing protein [Dehalococcoidia bacterium]